MGKGSDQRATEEKAAVLNAVERTKAEFRGLIESGRDPRLDYWFESMEQLALLGFEYGRKEGMRSWAEAQKKQEDPLT